MIKPGEIQRTAHENGVRDQQIEKDYVLSWILRGIAQHEILSKILAFKGGTVLKKVYFEDYRFSEDLDFTLLGEESSNEQIFHWFSEVFEHVREKTNIPFEIIDDTEHQDGGINFYIGYVGPLGGLGMNKRIKIDISKSEKLEFAPILQDVFVGYSDIDTHQLLCYRLEEVLIEKMRCVMQRMQARDFYDIWYLLDQHEMEVEFYLAEFSRKCSAKNLRSADFPKRLTERLPQYEARWKTSLSQQIKDLPDFAKAEREVRRRLRDIDFG